MRGILMLVPLLASLWVYNDARDRDYPPGEAFLWAAGTLLLVIFVLPLYLIMRKEKGVGFRQEETHPHQFGGHWKACSHCGKALEMEWVVCPYCGGKED